MLRRPLCLVLLLAGLVARAGAAETRPGGGAWRGPWRDVTPGCRDPRDPSPREEIPPPSLPPVPRPLYGGGERSGPRDRFGPVFGFAHVVFWWAYNRDAVMHEMDEAAPRPPLPAAIVAERVLPALEAVVRNTGVPPFVRANAALALARAGGPAGLLLDIARQADPGFGDIRSAGILALGLAGNGDPAEIHGALAGLCRNRDLPPGTRALAAIALGLRREPPAETLAVLDGCLDAGEPSDEVVVAALFALGLLGEPGAAPRIAEWLPGGSVGPRSFGGLESTWAVFALAGTGAAPIAPIFDTLRRKETLRRRSAAIALGRLIPAAPAGEQQVLAGRLAVMLRGEADDHARWLGFVSLGRIGGSPGAAPALRELCRSTLEERFRQEGYGGAGYAAVGLGLLARGAPDAAAREQAILPVRAALGRRKTGGEAFCGLALALGLAGDRSDRTVDLLLDLLADGGADRHLRGAAVDALGLLGVPRTGPQLVEALARPGDRDLRVHLAVAAGLAGGRTARPALLALFEDPMAGEEVLGAAAEAIGRLGDPEAVAPLLAILLPGTAEDRHGPDARAMAATALGLLCERSGAGVLQRLTADVNWRACVPVLDAVWSVK
jgi:HEAT repeat protein